MLNKHTYSPNSVAHRPGLHCPRTGGRRSGPSLRPVCRLKLALYGHPDAGGYWEMHCADHLKKNWFVPVADWSSMYYHPTLKLLLMVYVDDFKMSGPAKNMPEGWRLIRQGIKTDEPQAAGKCLGCDHKVRSVKLNGRMVNQIEYDMQGFMEQRVSVYLELTKRDKSCLKNANTPFLDDNAL